MKHARRRATYEDLCKVPEYEVAEIIDGELVVSPRPASPHALATSGIGADLLGPFHGPFAEVERSLDRWWRKPQANRG
jgi:hypothetical protein